jgi:hypothetical protein
VKEGEKEQPRGDARSQSEGSRRGWGINRNAPPRTTNGGATSHPKPGDTDQYPPLGERPTFCRGVGGSSRTALPRGAHVIIRSRWPAESVEMGVAACDVSRQCDTGYRRARIDAEYREKPQDSPGTKRILVRRRPPQGDDQNAEQAERKSRGSDRTASVPARDPADNHTGDSEAARNQDEHQQPLNCVRAGAFHRFTVREKRASDQTSRMGVERFFITPDGSY